MRSHLLTCSFLALLIAVGCAAEERHPLTKALDYDTNLLLVVDLRLSDRQLADLAQATQVAGTAIAVYDKARETALKSKSSLLAQEFKALSEGGELAAETAAGLDDLRQAQALRRVQRFAAVDAQIRRLRRSLSPEQAALVNWNRPSDVPAATDDTVVLEELRLLASRLTEAERFIERIRYLIPIDYIQTHVARTEEYLRPYVRPGTRDFDDARDWTVKLLDEARVVNEAEWPAQAPLFASQLLQHFGLLEQPGQANAQAQTRYGWWDVYYLLTDAQTPAMLQTMMNGPAPAANAAPNADN
ncbi:MAG: hypothetical protein WCP21_15525 [Armatimonadota bacterium]